MNTETWTVIATKPNHASGAAVRWRYEPGFSVRNVMVAVENGRLLTAHKRVPGGWHLVAKLPRPAKQVQR